MLGFIWKIGSSLGLIGEPRPEEWFDEIFAG